LWLFLAEAEITIESDPAEVPVICHVAVVVPVESVPILTVGAATLK
jgi:hypothetical protein